MDVRCRYKQTARGDLDLSRFNVEYWQHLDRTIASLQELGVEADLILFNVYDKPYPEGLECLGGKNATTYNVTHDVRYLRYVVARLASHRNVWWSIANEWDNAHCKWQRPSTPQAGGLMPITPGAAAIAWDTPVRAGSLYCFYTRPMHIAGRFHRVYCTVLRFHRSVLAQNSNLMMNGNMIRGAPGVLNRYGMCCSRPWQQKTLRVI